MKVTIERLPESRVSLDIAADDEEFARAMDRASRRVANEVILPGFRKGKAPRAMIERLYGREVFVEEANRELMTDLYRRALEQEDLVPVGDPEVDVVSAEPLAFKVTIPVYPTVEPGSYPEVRVDPIDAAVDEAAVDEVIDRLRKAHSPWVDPADEGLEVGPDFVLQPKTRTPREGDQVTIDYRVQEGGEEAEEPVEDAIFVLGESGLLDQLEEAIKALHVGESTTFSVSFAEDDESVDADIRGKTLTYTVTLKGLKERDLIPLDDDFARTAGEVDTLDELRRQVRDNLHQERTAAARSEVLTKIVDAMAERATVELPATMIDEAVDDDVQAMRRRLAQGGASLEAYLRLNNQTEDELRAELRPAATRRLRNSLLLREIARREGIAVDETELDASVERMAASAGSARDPKQAEAFFRSDYVRDVLRGEYFERRLSDRLIEIATEGRGAVTNGWVAPEPEPATEGGTPAEAGPAATAAMSEGDGDALDRSLTVGTMPGQPGDLAEAPVAEAAAEVDEVGATPAPLAGAETPEEREAQGEPGLGGSLPNPTS